MMNRILWTSRALMILPAVALHLSLFLFLILPAARAAPEIQYRPGPMLERFLQGPLSDLDEIIFAARVSGRDHWYVNFGNYSDHSEQIRNSAFRREDGVLWGYGEGGRLCRLNLRGGELKVILDDPRGGIRDPQVHYGGKKILFSYRKGGEHAYHLYEINTDGTGLRQLTDGPDDDIEPTYCPDGRIVFCSSRCRRFVNCWYSRVATLYICDGDGGNIRMISSNNDHDNTPWMLPDGRILYMRWEYVDRSQVHFHHLWAMNPDGTCQMAFYGNQFAGTVMLDAKPIPGTEKIVSSFSPGHGMPEHMGAVTVVNPNAGPDRKDAARQVSRHGQWFRDPYAFSEDCFLVANRRGIFVMDGAGDTELVYQLPRRQQGLECHEPRPLRKRPREPVIPDRVETSQETGLLVLQDIYRGRNMTGVKPGEIKKLLILEQLPKPVNFSGGMEPLTIGGTFTLARILGTVPVEPDGSASLRVPALRSLFFVALDENDLSVKRMQSFCIVEPGETTGCVGCHEDRTTTPSLQPAALAMQRPPSRIQPIRDVPDVFDFPRDIQPILDRHCTECHNPDRREGKVDLTGDHTPLYTVSYWAMVTHQLVSDGRNQPIGNRAPRTIGSSASRLLKFIDGSHYEAKLTPRETKMVRLWIESSATYPGTYAALGCGMYPVRFPFFQLRERCGSCHGSPSRDRRGPAVRFHFGAAWNPQSLCNLARPEKSVILRAPLARSAGGLGLCKEDVFQSTSDPAYRSLLAAITESSERLRNQKRFDMPGFRPNEHYIREMQRFGCLPRDLGPEDPVDIYKTDEAYWRSFWYQPRGSSGEKTARR